MQYHKNTGLRWRTYRYIEGLLLDYHLYPKLIKDRRNEVSSPYRVSDENTGGGRSSIPHSAIERIAISWVTDERLVKLEREYEAIKQSLSELTNEQRKVIELAYLTRPKNRTWDTIASECSYSRSQCYRIRDRLILRLSEILGMS